MTNGPEQTEIATGGDSALETALRQALRHEDAPAGFADRVLGRASGAMLQGSAAAPPPAALTPGSKVLAWPQRRLWLTGVIAAALVAGVFEGEVAYRHMRAQQQRVVEATRQFQTTERITVHALAQAREQLQRAGVPLDID